MVLNRWANGHSEGGLLHPVAASRELRLREVQYTLCATVVHLGDSLRSGRYIALARHRTKDADWWLYDDVRRTIATPEQVATTCAYQGMGPMQSYVLFYERTS